jgi:outer membrane receptor protein involved in Fe transport
MDALRQSGFTFGTDEFRGVPGIYVRRGEGDGDEFPFVTIRGVTGNHGNDTFLAMVDGVPFVGPDEEVLLYEVPYASVDRVEIVRGPVSALYGRGAIAGAVNYLTRTPTEDATRLSAIVGDDGYMRAEGILELAAREHALLGSVAYEEYEGWREQSERENLNLFAKGVFRVSDRTTLTGYLNYLDRKGEVPSAIPTFADGTIVDVIGGSESFLGYGDTKNDLTGVLGALRVEHEASDDLSFSFTAHGRSFDSDVFLNFYDSFGFDPSRNVMAVNGFRSDSTSDVLFGEATVNWKAGRHQLVAGLSAERATLDEREYWSGQYGFTPECGFAFFLVEIDYTTGQVLNRNHPCFLVDEPQADADTTNKFWSVFLQDEIALNDRWSLTIGGRYDAFERDTTFQPLGPFNPGGDVQGDTSEFSPKASVSWRYDAGQVYVSYGRGFNSNFGPVWQWDPSQYARAEEPTTIDSVELGWKGRALDERLQFEAALFQLLQKNRRVFVDNPDPTGPPTLATTGQRYESRGFEATVAFSPGPDTTLSLNYTWLDPEWDEYVVDTFAGPVDLSGNEPRGVPNHMAFLAAEHRFAPWFKARAAYEWYGDYQITEDNAHRGGEYDLLTLSGSFDWRDNWGIDLAILNALDEEYFAYFGNQTDVLLATPGVPRQIRATLRARF